MTFKLSKNYSANRRGRKHKIRANVRVLVFGTFDVIHSGHLHFFRQAKRLARHAFLIVSVARDKNVKRIKGRQPVHKEKQRLANIRKIKPVGLAVLSARADYLGHIVKLRPAIIALGYDQTAYTGGLGQKLAARGLKVIIKRLKPYKIGRFKSSLIKNHRLWKAG